MQQSKWVGIKGSGEWSCIWRWHDSGILKRSPHFRGKGHLNTKDQHSSIWRHYWYKLKLIPQWRKNYKAMSIKTWKESRSWCWVVDGLKWHRKWVPLPDKLSVPLRGLPARAMLIDSDSLNNLVRYNTPKKK